MHFFAGEELVENVGVRAPWFELAENLCTFFVKFFDGSHNFLEFFRVLHLTIHLVLIDWIKGTAHEKVHHKTKVFKGDHDTLQIIGFKYIDLYLVMVGFTNGHASSL